MNMEPADLQESYASMSTISSPITDNTIGANKVQSSSKKSSSSERFDDVNEAEDDEVLPTEDNPHRTTITMTIAVAYPKASDDQSRILEDLVKKNKKTIEAPKPIHFLHCEYFITPQTGQMATDVVTYSVAAKIFTDNESRVLKTWDDGEKVWVAWVHTHEIAVTMDNASALLDHVLEVKMWDSKDKISSKARGDKPRAFRLPSETEFKFPGQGIYGVVSRMSDNWKTLQPKSSSAYDSQQTSLDFVFEPTVPEASNTPEPEEKESQVEKQRSSLLRKLAGINASDEEKRRMNDLKRQRTSLRQQLSKSGKPVQSQVNDDKKSKNTKGKANEKKSPKKTKSATNRRTSVYGQGKCVSIKLRFENLFAGMTTTASRLDDRTGTVIDGFVTVTADKPLLPAAAKRVLNPTTIKIRSVKDLPNTPIPRAILQKTSKPVYCSYEFLDKPTHITNGRPHGKHVYFEDTHVVFLGLFNEGLIREYILNNSFHIDVHDRDQLNEQDTGEGNIFGVESIDEHLSSVALVSAKRTAYNAFQTIKKGFDPFGVARVSLVDILRGSTKLNAEVAVAPCAMPEIVKEPVSSDGGSKGLIGVHGAVDRPERAPAVCGDYLQAGTTLKVQITLSYPIVPLAKAPRLLPLPMQVNPFARFVIFFDYSNKELLHRIENFVTMENAKALGLHHFEKNLIDAALSTFKLTKEQKHSLTLDIITGFHVIDGKVYLMVLEGLEQGAMERLFKEIDFTKKSENDFLIYLYDTSMTFGSRLYSSLDVDLCRVRLHQPLSEIMSQPLLYIREMIPRECLECVIKLHEIMKLRKFRDIAHSNLFPTAEMVISMSREFGIPLTVEDFDTDQLTSSQLEVSANEAAEVEMVSAEVLPHRSKRMASLDNSNREFEQLLKRRKSHPSKVNHVSANIISVQEAGKRHRPSHPSVRSLHVDAPAHNYSSQSLNSMQMAKNLLREVLYENKADERYSYAPEYMSAMVAPVDIDSYYRKKDMEAKEMWKTKEGFIYPGKRTSRDDNVHPLKPTDSRIEDLKYSFRDNVLHRNVLNPLLDRENFKWKDRKKDMQLYSGPKTDFRKQFPYSIMLAGDLKIEEEGSFKQNEKKLWKEKVIVDDVIMKFHRLLWETESRQRSNQIDRLASLLKDHPMKFSLAKKPAPVIPPLSVVFNPSVDTVARNSGKKLPPAFDPSSEKHVGFVPGPFESRRWVLESNKIPIKDEQHKTFASKHGHDLNLYNKERSLLSSRIPVKSLTEEEYKTHLFRIPPIALKSEDDIFEEIPEAMERRDSFGQGPRERSEYRYMYPAHNASRVREVYPRHTFRGFGPLDKDGKPIAREASVELVMTDRNFSDNDVTSGHTEMNRGTLLKDEARVELAPASISCLNSVQVA